MRNTLILVRDAVSCKTGGPTYDFLSERYGIEEVERTKRPSRGRGQREACSCRCADCSHFYSAKELDLTSIMDESWGYSNEVVRRRRPQTRICLDWICTIQTCSRQARSMFEIHCWEGEANPTPNSNSSTDQGLETSARDLVATDSTQHKLVQERLRHFTCKNFTRCGETQGSHPNLESLSVAIPTRHPSCVVSKTHPRLSE